MDVFGTDTKAAADAAATTKKEIERGEAPVSVSQKEETAVKPSSDNTDGASNTDGAPKSEIKKAPSYRVKSKEKDNF